MQNVAIVDVAFSSPSFSLKTHFREEVFSLVSSLYNKYSLSPWDIDSFLSVKEDLEEGILLVDGYYPDPLGAKNRPFHSLAGDFLQGIFQGVSLIQSGLANMVLIESHVFYSQVKSPSLLEFFSLDPIYERYLPYTPYFYPALEAKAFLEENSLTEKDMALWVLRSRERALKNPLSVFSSSPTLEEILSSSYIASPLKKLDIAPYVDGAGIMLLAREEEAKNLTSSYFLIEGISSFSYPNSLSLKDFTSNISLKRAVGELISSSREVDLIELPDFYSYRALMHIKDIEAEEERVNLSGGSLGMGYTGALTSFYQLVYLLYFSSSWERALVSSWRGFSSGSSSSILIRRCGR